MELFKLSENQIVDIATGASWFRDPEEFSVCFTKETGFEREFHDPDGRLWNHLCKLAGVPHSIPKRVSKPESGDVASDYADAVGASRTWEC